jgi:hypothetical protein
VILPPRHDRLPLRIRPLPWAIPSRAPRSRARPVPLRGTFQ